MKNLIKNLGQYAKKGSIPWNKGKQSLPCCKNCGISLKDYRSIRCKSCNAKLRMKLISIANGGYKKGCLAWNKGVKGEKSHMYGKKQTLGKEPWNKGKKCPKISQSKQGKKMSVKARKNMSIAQSGKLRPWNRGANNHFWKGGVTPIHKAIRSSLEYRQWRELVFKRDNYTCQICDHKSRGGYPSDIHADHIKPFALYPELRLDINNGRTLCIDCHKQTTTWGYSSIYRQLNSNRKEAKYGYNT